MSRDDSRPSERQSGVDAVFAALADPTRRAVLQRLGDGEATPTELAAELPVTRQAVSKHLALLTDAGLVDRTRAGRQTRYQANPIPFNEAISWMASVGAGWDQRLAHLDDLVRGGAQRGRRDS